MPVTRIPLEDHEVREELLRRGYGFHLSNQAPLWLTIPDPVNKRQTGVACRIQLAPVSKAKYDRILNFCETIHEACDQVEHISHGRLTDPHIKAEHQGGPGLDSETIERIVKARVDSAVVQGQQAQSIEIGKLRTENESLMASVRALLEKLEAPKAKKKITAKKPAATIEQSE